MYPMSSRTTPICGLRSYKDFLRQQHHGEEKEEASLKLIYYGSCLAFEIFSVILDQIRNKHVYPVVHAYLAFVWSMTCNDTTRHIDGLVPWQKVTTFLNKMDHNNIDFNVIECDEFPIMGGACTIEDLLIDGYIWSQGSLLWLSPIHSCVGIEIDSCV